jgi:Icc-related predicted phosphoesterase
MRLLLFSDLHADADAARRLVAMAEEADVVIGAGDFAILRRRIRVGIEVLRSIERPTVLVAGNHETAEELIDACRDWPGAQVLHGSGTTLGGVAFFGLGGGVPVTPFGDWSYDLTEDQAAALLADCPDGGVLVSHSPPKGLVDADSTGRSLGSTAVLAAIERRRPRLVVCGHIHERAGHRASHGPSTVVNSGPDGLLWDLDAGRPLDEAVGSA